MLTNQISSYLTAMDDNLKRLTISRELNQAGLYPNVPVTFNQIYAVLDSKNVEFTLTKGNQGFDRGVGDQLLNRLDDGRQSATPEQFAQVWVDAEKKILDRIQVAQANLDRINEKMMAVDENIVKLRQQPQTQQRMLIFRVIEATGFGSGVSPSFQLSVSDKSSGNITMEQFMRERFSIFLNNQDRSATLSVNPSPDQRSFDGRIDINIEGLANPQGVTKEFAVPLTRGGAGSVTIFLQVVNNYAQYYASLRQGYEQSAIENRDNFLSYAEMLETMYRPFTGLKSERDRVLGNIKMPQDVALMGLGPAGGPNKIRGYADNSMVAGNNSMFDRPSLYAGNSNFGPSQLMKPELREASMVYIDPNSNRAATQELAPFSTTKDYKQFHPFNKFLFYIMWALLLVALLVGLLRPTFIPAMVSTTFIIWYFVKEVISWGPTYSFYAFALAISIIVDVAWVWNYTPEWWDDPYVDSASLDGTRSFTLLVSYILILLEVAALFFSYSLSSNEKVITRRY